MSERSPVDARALFRKHLKQQRSSVPEAKAVSCSCAASQPSFVTQALRSQDGNKSSSDPDVLSPFPKPNLRLDNSQKITALWSSLRPTAGSEGDEKLSVRSVASDVRYRAALASVKGAALSSTEVDDLRASIPSAVPLPGLVGLSKTPTKLRSAGIGKGGGHYTTLQAQVCESPAWYAM
jgi:hypothetical protein